MLTCDDDTASSCLCPLISLYQPVRNHKPKQAWLPGGAYNDVCGHARRRRRCQTEGTGWASGAITSFVPSNGVFVGVRKQKMALRL